MTTTELALGPPRQRIYCCAADKDQAALLFQDVVDLFRAHPTLRDVIRVAGQTLTVKATGSTLTMLASDAPSAYGLRPDLLVCDEVGEWRGRALWDSVYTATGKKPHTRILTIFTPSWDLMGIAKEIADMAAREPSWHLSHRDQCASWVSASWLAQQERSLPRHVFERLHRARWVEGSGAWLSQEQVDRIFSQPIPHDHGRGAFSLGVDLGISRDRSVVALVRSDEALVIIERLVTYTPTKWAKVNLDDVETDIAALALRYRAPVLLDPFQAIGMTQRLSARGIRSTEYPFTSESRKHLFGGLLDLVSAGALRSAPHDVLRRELLGLSVTESASGWRVDHARSGHDDHVVAVGLAIAGLPANRSGEMPVLAGREMAVYAEGLRQKYGPLVEDGSSEAKSIARWHAQVTGPGGAGVAPLAHGRKGLIL